MGESERQERFLEAETNGNGLAAGEAGEAGAPEDTEEVAGIARSGGPDASPGYDIGIEEDLLRIASADKKTISIKWDSPHERMARDLETDLHFDRGLSTRTVNRSTLSALGLELLYEKFYGKKPPGI